MKKSISFFVFIFFFYFFAGANNTNTASDTTLTRLERAEANFLQARAAWIKNSTEENWENLLFYRQNYLGFLNGKNKKKSQS